MADYQQNFLSALAGGLQVGQQIKQQRDTSHINRLAGLAYGADPGQRESIIGQMHQVNPQMAQQQEKGMAYSDERRQRTMVNMAGHVMNMPPQSRANFYNKRLLPVLRNMGIAEAPEWTPETEPVIMKSVQDIYNASTGAGASSDLKSFNAYTQGLSPEDVAKARRIKLGLDPRAVTGAMRFDTFIDANGNPRPQRNNPTTGQVEIYVDETGQWQPLGGGQTAQSAPQPGTYGTPNGMVRIGDLTPEQWASAQEDMASGGTLENVTLPPRDVSPAQFSTTGLGVGRRKEDETRAIEQAKADVQLRNLPTELDMRTDAALREAGGKAAVEAGAKRQAVQADNDRSFSLYDTAMKGVSEGLDSAMTGPLAGRLPAVTAGQQIAEGGVAAIAPVLKQLFRSAGEGTFTDKDQELLLAMIPTRTDLPEARAWKIENIDRIVREKLGQPQKGGGGGAPQAAGGQQQQPQQRPVMVNSPAEYNALPAGALYTAPDGSTRRKK